MNPNPHPSDVPPPTPEDLAAAVSNAIRETASNGPYRIVMSKWRADACAAAVLGVMRERGALATTPHASVAPPPAPEGIDWKAEAERLRAALLHVADGNISPAISFAREVLAATPQASVPHAPPPEGKP